MARISRAEMEVRENALQDILEDATKGLTVTEITEALKAKDINLPKSEYQAVLIVLKHAESKHLIEKVGKKWKLLNALIPVEMNPEIFPEESDESEAVV